MKFFLPLFLSFFLLTLPGYSAGESVTVRRPKAESYREDSLGIVFPDRLGKFVKSEVVKHNNPLVGTLIRYADENGACGDIYIYSINMSSDTLSDKSSEDHFNLCADAIRKLPDSGGVVSEVLAKGAFREGIMRVAKFNIVANETPSESVLAVFPFKNKIVKIRLSLSGTGDEKSDAKAFLQDVAALFKLGTGPKK